MDKLGLYRKVLLTEGEDHQINMCIEECSELIQALCKYKRGKPDNVCEEIADCEILFEQMKLLFNQDERVEGWKAFKLDRLAELVEYKECGV
jgi:hypothetical protein